MRDSSRPPLARERLSRVCIVTGEFVGPQPCGGIGTAMTGLAHALAAAGHSVTVLYTRGMWVTPRRQRAWKAEAAERGIDLAFLTPVDIGRPAGPLADVAYTVPSAVLDWLSTRSFDIVHFNEMEADGYLAVAARQSGIAFCDMAMVVGLHSPTAWVEEINREITAGPLSVVMTAAERLGMASADLLWGPSDYLRQWVEERGYPLPERAVTQQYVLPDWRHLSRRDQASDGPGEKMESLVFFGRLEERKGLLIFLDALDMLAQELARDEIEVVFLGKSVMVSGISSRQLIAERAKRWSFAWRHVEGLKQPEAVAFLREPGRLAVMASPADNSPCTVYEAMEYGIPFIAARAGGVPELIHADDAAHVLFDPGAAALSERVRDALRRAPHVPRPARTPGERRDAWLASHDAETGWAAAVSLVSQPQVLSSRRRLMVILQDVGDDAALTRSIASLGTITHFAPVITVLSERDLPSLPQDVGALSSRELYTRLDGWRREAPCELLVVTAGVELLADAAAMIERAMVHDRVWLIPSVISEGRRCDSPPISVATGLAWGANPLGICLINADILFGVLDGAGEAPETRGQCLGALLDRALLAGAWPQPYPKAIATAGPTELSRSRPAITPERVGLFAKASPADLIGIVAIAATQGLGGKLLARRLAYRVSRTKLSWLTPYLIAVAERLRTWRR